MNRENSKTYDPQRLILHVFERINLKRIDKQIALSNLSIYYTWKNQNKTIQTKNSYKNKLEISAWRWNEEFELPDESYSVADIQDSFEYILKNMIQLLIILKQENM